MRISPFAGGTQDWASLYNNVNEEGELNEGGQPNTEEDAGYLELPEMDMIIGSNSSLLDVFGQKDIRNITQNEYANLTAELYASNQISRDQYIQLRGVEKDLSVFGVSREEVVDMYEFYENIVERLEKSKLDSEMNEDLAEERTKLAKIDSDAATQRLRWVEKFAALTEFQDGLLGVDALV